MTWSYFDYQTILIRPEVFAAFFKKILRKKTFLVIVVGDTGSGKSYVVCSICEMITPDFCRDDVIDILGDIKPRLRAFEEQTRQGRQTPKVITLDDFGSELDVMEYGTTAAKQTSWLMQKGRKFKVGCFLTVPDKEMINKTFRDRIPNFLIEVLGHNEKTGMAQIKMYRIQRNKITGKVYYHRLFYNPEKDKITTKKKEGDFTNIVNSRFNIPKPSQALIDWYEPFREELGRKQLLDNPKDNEEQDGRRDVERLEELIMKSENPQVFFFMKRKKKRLNIPLVTALLSIDGHKVGRTLANDLAAYFKYKGITQ